MKLFLLLSLFTVVTIGPLFTGSLTAEQFAWRAAVARWVPLPPATCTPVAGDAASLKTCITNAARGDTISVPLGTYSTTTPYQLTNKSGSFSGSNYITIQSAAIASLSVHRQTPADTINMPMLVMAASGINLIEVTGTGWKLDGLELTNNIPLPITNTTPALVFCDTTSADLFFDRLILHPHETPNVANGYMTTGRYAFNEQGDRVTVQRSYIYNFFGKAPDDALLQGMVASQPITSITSTNPAVIQYSGSPAVANGDRVHLELTGLDNYFAPSGPISGDWVVTVIDTTHFSVPVDLTGVYTTWNTLNTRAIFFRWPRMSSITLGNPTTITMSQAHGMTTGQKVRPQGLLSTLGAALVGNDYTVTVTGATTFTIPVNTTGLSAYSGSGGYYSPQGSGQQTESFGIGADVNTFNAINNYSQAWYASLQTGGSDSSATISTTVIASPAPTFSDVYMASTTGISPGMLIAMDTTHFDDPTKCPVAGFGDRPCFAFGVVGTVNSGTGQVHFAEPLKIFNGAGFLITPLGSVLVPGTVNVNGKNPTNINLYYNTLDAPLDFAAIHHASNGNTPKGFIEGKNCTTCMVEGNIMQGWPSTFAETSVNQNGSSPWGSTFNVTIRNNWFKSYFTGVLESFASYGNRNTQGYGLTVTNNLFNGGMGFSSTCFVPSNAASDVVFSHNTCTNGLQVVGGTAVFSNFASIGAGDPYYRTALPTGVVYRDNLVDAGLYSAICYIAGIGQSSFAPCFTGPVLTYNGFVKTFTSADPLAKFTDPSNKVTTDWNAAKLVGTNPNTLSDWALQPASPFYHQASDGSDMGVNITTLAAALAFNDGFGPVPLPSARLSGKTTFSGLYGFGQPTHPTGFFASPTGSGTQCTFEAPCSLTTAAAGNSGAIPAGSTIYLRGGIYQVPPPAGGAGLTFAVAGSSSTVITVYAAYPGERPIITATDNTPPNIHMANYQRLDGLWIGGTRQTSDTADIFIGAESGLISHWKQIVNCTFWGYYGGILSGSAEYALIQSNRFVRMGGGSLFHAIYISGPGSFPGPPGTQTQHVIIDNNMFIAGLGGYGVHFFHNNRTGIATRNFVNGNWGMVFDGIGFLSANNFFWKTSHDASNEAQTMNYGQGGIMWINNILGLTTLAQPNPPPVGTSMAKTAFENGQSFGSSPITLTPGNEAAQIGISAASLDGAISTLNTSFSGSPSAILADATIETNFATIKTITVPGGSPLFLTGQPWFSGAATNVGPNSGAPANVTAFWTTYRALGLPEYDANGNLIP